MKSTDCHCTYSFFMTDSCNLGLGGYRFILHTFRLKKGHRNFSGGLNDFRIHVLSNEFAFAVPFASFGASSRSVSGIAYQWLYYSLCDVALEGQDLFVEQFFQSEV